MSISVASCFLASLEAKYPRKDRLYIRQFVNRAYLLLDTALEEGRLTPGQVDAEIEYLFLGTNREDYPFAYKMFDPLRRKVKEKDMPAGIF